MSVFWQRISPFPFNSQPLEHESIAGSPLPAPSRRASSRLRSSGYGPPVDPNVAAMKQSQSDQDEEARLGEKLRKIEALFARAASAGERAAAEGARDRIRQRLEQLENAERAIEFRFSLPD